ncbi:hypothetical protein [Marinospirillum alkaliphilum]|uniref:Uncharacterized protein n=1 Tax=Marinospirillum alkaliphilum DSM 21637 TaxID=1122209 RepID=A0A1K1WAH7_9GAMM|nr:hypothetical protein [Marinospirillum alkaliphilum]SFX33813.1 hypothetical protein SAMN02745752_01351 [Marinospirillum alkaliphilum DSM 21637]
MQLPDFTEFEPFRELRLAMGARKTGHFELFNAEKHLTGKERSELDQQGRQLPLARLKRFADHTWGLKNTRLVVYLENAGDYHLAQCPVTDAWSASQTVWISTRRTGGLPVGPQQEQQREVCAHCLQLLGYKGFDLQRNRKIAYSKNLVKTFSREEFFRIYTLYPVQGMAEKLAENE